MGSARDALAPACHPRGRCEWLALVQHYGDELRACVQKLIRQSEIITQWEARLAEVEQLAIRARDELGLIFSDRATMGRRVREVEARKRELRMELGLLEARGKAMCDMEGATLKDSFLRSCAKFRAREQDDLWQPSRDSVMVERRFVVEYGVVLPQLRLTNLLCV